MLTSGLSRHQEHQNPSCTSRSRLACTASWLVLLAPPFVALPPEERNTLPCVLLLLLLLVQASRVKKEVPTEALGDHAELDDA